ncbi:hypothetical protein DFH09DRAFT_1104597 [Mycena vulgaris]|nr:hypothetical protein DFH09DRAFT_1104597 [Mycena vulgaris]
MNSVPIPPYHILMEELGQDPLWPAFWIADKTRPRGWGISEGREDDMAKGGDAITQGPHPSDNKKVGSAVVLRRWHTRLGWRPKQSQAEREVKGNRHEVGLEPTRSILPASQCGATCPAPQKTDMPALRVNCKRNEHHNEFFLGRPSKLVLIAEPLGLAAMENLDFSQFCYKYKQGLVIEY